MSLSVNRIDKVGGGWDFFLVDAIIRGGDTANVLLRVPPYETIDYPGTEYVSLKWSDQDFQLLSALRAEFLTSD